MSLEVSILKQPETLREEWQALAEKCADKDAYVQPFFLLTWGEQTKEQWSPEYIVVRRDGKLVGLLPLFRRSLKGCRILGFPVSGSTPPFDLIAEMGSETEVATAVAASLKARRDWDLLLLHRIDLQLPPAAALAEALKDAGDYTIREAGSTFVIDTREGTYEEFFSSRSSNFRKSLNRWTRRHSDMGEIKTLECPGELSLPDAMQFVERILARSWKGEENSNEDSIRRMRQLAEAGLAEGKLRLTANIIDDGPSSYLLSFDHANRLFAFNNAYDLSLHKIGPGQVQLKEAVKRALEDRTEEIDLGGGYSYLRKWATGTRDFHEIQLVRRGLRSRVIAAAYLKGKDERNAKAREAVEKKKDEKKDEAKAKGKKRALKPIWSEGLAKASQPAGNLFLEDEWLEAYSLHQPAGPITVRSLSQGEMRLALTAGKERVRRLPCKVIRVLGDPLADQCWFKPSSSWDWTAAVSALSKLSDWDVAILSELTCEAAERSEINAALASAGLVGHWRQCGKAPVVPLSIDGAPLANAHYSSTLRRRLKRSRKKLDQAGEVSVVHKIPTPEDTVELIKLLKDIEDGSWKGDAETGLFSEQNLPFVKDLSQRLAASGKLEIYLLLLDDKPISYRYGFRYAGRFLDYNLAYLKEYHHLSPGRILLDEIIKTSQALGLEAVDASRGSMERPHILCEWPGYIREHHRLIIFAPTVKGRLLHAIETKLRPFVLTTRKLVRKSD